MRIRNALVLLAIALSVTTSAQTRTDRHPGKVEIGSTATDALTVGGSTKTTGVLVGTGTPPAGGVVITSGAIVAEGAAVANYTGLGIYSNVTSPDWTQFVFGDGTGYRLNFGARVSGNFASKMRLYDNGQLQHVDGSASVPSMSFMSATNMGFFYDGSAGVSVTAAGFQTQKFALDNFQVLSRAMGTGNVGGPTITVGYNTSGGGAPGTVNIRTKVGGSAYLWIDTSGNVRINNAPPTEVLGDLLGVVVGTQTSTRASKNILRRERNTAWAMGAIRQAPIYRFTYKSGAFHGQEFVGITTDDSPLFGMDQGKSFNPVTAFGVTALAVQDVDKRITALEAQVAALTKRLAAREARRR